MAGITKSITTRWSAAAKVEALEKGMASFLANKAYQSEIVGANKIKVIGVASPTITPYVPGTTSTTPEVITDNEVIIEASEKYFYAISADAMQIAESQPDYVPAVIITGTHGLVEKEDEYFAGRYVEADAGNIIAAVGSPVEITEVNVQRYTSLLARTLRENHVQRGDMWALVPPWYMDKLASAVGQRLTDNAQVLGFGTVFEYAGLKIVESTYAIQNAGVGTDESIIMGFSTRAIAMVENFNNFETFTNPLAFGEVIRHGISFGAEVLFPKEVAYFAATEGTETV